MTPLTEAEERSVWARIDAVMAGDKQVEPLTEREQDYLVERVALAYEEIEKLSPEELQRLSRQYRTLR